MGVCVKSVILIGVKDSEFTWDTLTEKSKNMIIDEVISNSPVDEDELTEEGRNCFEDQAREYFNENRNEILTDWFNLAVIGSYWSGEISHRGIEVYSISLKGGYEDKINEFEELFNLEPDLYNGVLEY